MIKIWNWLMESHRSDHLIGGALWALCFCLLSLLLGVSIWTAYLLSVLSAAGIGAGLEFKDNQYGGSFDIWDLLMTITGAAIICALPLLITLF